MPSYFYHLKLELYPSSSASSGNDPQQQVASPKSIYLPQHNTDIFKTQFPVHRKSKWLSYPFESKHKHQNASESGSDSGIARSRPQSSTSRQETHGDALLLPERNTALKLGSASPALSPAKASSKLASRDWRFGPVSIESIDMVTTTMADSATEGTAEKTTSKDNKSTGSGLHTKGIYLPSEPKTTDVAGVSFIYIEMLKRRLPWIRTSISASTVSTTMPKISTLMTAPRYASLPCRRG